MAQQNTAALFAALDDLGSLATDYAAESAVWSADTSTAIGEAKAISANTADKAYRRLTSSGNVTSYSLLSKLHECPRAYELDKLEANSKIKLIDIDGPVNLDFAYGHAVGAGIQTYAATGSLTASIFAAMTAWRAPWDAEKFSKQGKPTGKSLTMATLAVQKFSYWWAENMTDWEVVVLPGKLCDQCNGGGEIVATTNHLGPDDYDWFDTCPACKGAGTLPGKKAVELAFAVDFQNGKYHFGHIDVMLRNRATGAFAVWEGKTTGFENVNEAMYANSSQALGYSVVVDAIAAELGADGTEYEVLYIVYSSVSREFQLLPFGKTRVQRAEWLQDVLLDHAMIDQYEKIQFYPKRGESCLGKYGFTCKWFGSCGMRNSSLFPGVQLSQLHDVDSVEALDFKFKLDELVAVQQQKVTGTL